MSSKAGGLITAVIGAGVALVSALADVLGIGNDPTRFAAQQLFGTLGGSLLFLAGLVVFFRSR